MNARRFASLLRLLASLAIVTVCFAPSSTAHATVTGSSPTNGVDLAAAPRMVSITFDESVGLRPGYLRVVDDAGTRVDAGNLFHPAGRADSVAVLLRSGLSHAHGYLASFRVVSADAHPLGGVVRFTVGGGARVGAEREASGSRAVPVLMDVATALLYFGLALAGGAWLLLGGADLGRFAERGRRVVRGGLVLALSAALAQLGLQGPYAAGLGPAHVLDSALLSDTMATSFGRWHRVVAIALIVLLGLTTMVSGRRSGSAWRRRAAVAGGAAVWMTCLVAVAASGHAAVARPGWLVWPSTVAHLVAMTTWIGGLVLLVAVLLPAFEQSARESTTPRPARELALSGQSRVAWPEGAVLLPPSPPGDEDEPFEDSGTRAAAGQLAGFSRVALMCVVLLAGTGLTQAWVETGSMTALLSTTYGRLELSKAVLFLLVIGLASRARRHVRRRDRPGALRRGVLTELAVLVGVLAVTSVLVAQPPAKQALVAQQAAAPASATAIFSPTWSAVVTVRPARRGPVRATVHLRGVPQVTSLTMTATLPAAGIGPLPVPLSAVPGAPADFRAQPVTLPVPGRWRLQLALQTSPFDSVVTDVELVVH